MEIFSVQYNCTRLDKYLRQKFGSFPQATIQKALRKRLVKLNGLPVEASASLVEGDFLFISGEFLRILSSIRNSEGYNSNSISAQFMRLITSKIIYEDENIIAIDKPFGVSVQAGAKVERSLDRVMKAMNPEYRVVHRLDKHTTGVLIFAKNLETTREMWQLFSNRLIKKKYLAIVVGNLRERKGQIDCYIKKNLFEGEERMQCNDCGDGERAITEFQVIKNFGHLSLVELIPLTGRKHQIRTQMASIGYPILNDGKYGRKQSFIYKTDNKKLSLHASEIEFELFGQKINVRAQLPKHFTANLPKQ